jgi:hypothetical protein
VRVNPAFYPLKLVGYLLSFSEPDDIHIPEFPTVALPVMVIPGITVLFREKTD